MRSLLQEVDEAFDTTDRVIAALTYSPDRDAAFDRLIEAIEQDRAELLAAMIGGQALHREPRHIPRHAMP